MPASRPATRPPATQPRMLLLSNSRNAAGEYLVHARDAIRAFIGGRSTALFFPFAGTTVEWNAYRYQAQEALAPVGLQLSSAHTSHDLAKAVRDAEILLVGGGNTFRLLHEMRVHGALDVVRDAVLGGKPYIGWSAGAVLASPTIGTTNDMPIVNPGGFDALGLVPFQINAHYTNRLPSGHSGETRNQRLLEYLVLNPHSRVLALPEGNWLEVEGLDYALHGPKRSQWFLPGKAPRSIASGPFKLP